MLKRLMAAVVALGVVLPIIFMGGQIGLELLVGLVLVIVLHEFAPIVSAVHIGSARRVLWLIGGGTYAVATWCPDIWLGPVVVFASAVLLTWSMFVHQAQEDGMFSGAIAAAAVPYLCVGLAFIGKVRALDEGPSWLMLVLIATWAADTGAYFAGRAFGNKKLMPRISPKKTWAGVYGGMALTVVVCLVMASMGWPGIPWVHAAGIGVVISTTGVVGDLVESMFKRARGIKDSGSIMPGHGGLFDRVDSLLFTMPAVWIYAALFSL